MQFETVYSSQSRTEKGKWEYFVGEPIILNSNYIIEVKKVDKSPRFSSEAAEKLSKIFDLPTSELSLFQISIYNKDDEFIVMPDKKFKDFIK